MTVAGIATVPVVPDLKGFGAALFSGVTKEVDKLAGDVKAKFGGIFSEVGPEAAGAAAGVAIVGGALLKAGEAAADYGQDVLRLQRITGQSAQDTSKLAFALHEVGISNQQASVGLSIFSKKLVDGGAAFEKYGITLNKANGQQKSFDEVLAEVANKYNALGPGIQRAALLQDAFGRSGRNLAPLLAKGAAGIKELADEAERYGLVLSQKDLEASRELAESQRRLQSAFLGLEVSVGRGVIPVLERFSSVVGTTVSLINKAQGATGVSGLESMFLQLGHIAAPAATAALEAYNKIQATGAIADENRRENIAKFEAQLRSGKSTVESLTAEIQKLNLPDSFKQDLLLEVAAAATNLDNAAGAAGDAAGAIGDVGSAADGASDPVKSLAQVTADLAQSARDAYSAQLSLEGSFLGVEGAALDMRDAEKKVVEDRAALNKLTKEGKKNTQDYRDAQEQLTRDLLASGEASLNFRKTVQDYISTLKGSTTTRAEMVAHLRSVLRQAGYTKGEIDTLIGTVQGLINKYKAVPKEVKTHVFVEGLQQASDEFSSWLTNLRVQGAAGIAVAARLYNVDQGLPNRQHGGSVMPNQAYIVGERGPEVFQPNQAGTIIPNGRWAPQGGSTRPIVISVQIDRREIARAVQHVNIWEN